MMVISHSMMRTRSAQHRQVGAVGKAAQDGQLAADLQADQCVGSGGRDVGQEVFGAEVAVGQQDHPGVQAA